MISSHRSDSIILFFDWRNGGYDDAIDEVTMHDDREHVISVVLNHAEWEEFVKQHPQPVVWLRERIQETISAARPQEATAATQVPLQVA